MLEAHAIYFKFEHSLPWVIENFSFQIRQDEVVGIHGVSGKGKTTFARILSGHYRPQKGIVTLDSHALPYQGFCPVQLLIQHPETAVNPRWKIGKIISELQMPESSLLESLSIDKRWFNRFPHEVSGGELQRICIARILKPEVRYLIADEITAMVDPNTQAQLWDVIIQFKKRHSVGIVVISHDFSLLKRLCTSTIEL